MKETVSCLSIEDNDPIDVFISHADEEKKIAGDLKQKLERFGLNAFVAHDDISGGADWNRALIEKIEECDIFLAILSKAYHDAAFTDQEAGIAYAMKKPIIPISIDGTMPYGFIAKYQAIKRPKGFKFGNVGEINDLIHLYTDKGQKRINELIGKLTKARNFVAANAVARELFDYSKFTKEQLDDIARAVIDNYEVRGSWTAGPRSLETLQKNWKKIEPDLRNELRRWMKDKQIDQE